MLNVGDVSYTCISMNSDNLYPLAIRGDQVFFTEALLHFENIP